MYFLGLNFVSGLICTRKSKKKPFKNLKTQKPKKTYKLFPKKPSFFPALIRSVSIVQHQSILKPKIWAKMHKKWMLCINERTNRIFSTKYKIKRHSRPHGKL